jgi:hypothetical protein
VKEQDDQFTRRLARWKKLSELVTALRAGELPEMTAEAIQAHEAARKRARAAANAALEAIINATRLPSGSYDYREAQRQYRTWLQDHVDVATSLVADRDIEDYVAAEQHAWDDAGDE